jgi:P-type Cu+ transporter
METIQWKVEGMTCANCALTINKFLEKEGQQNIRVNPIDGDISFETVDGTATDTLKKGIEALGYHVVPEKAADALVRKRWLSNHLSRFLFCLPFTTILLMHMLHAWLPLHFLMNPWVQLGLCLPVYIVGMQFFGRSAIKSLRNGVPNMNVLIALGATSAFVYSLVGTFLRLGPDYLFYETTATIITLVFLGNYLEDASMQSTQRALKGLIKSQKVMANMIAFDDQHQEIIFPMENNQLKVGDLILINSGEQVPIDCKILWGEAHVNEAILTGESLPVHKHAKDRLIGGSILDSGSVRAQVTATGDDTVLSGILKMVKKAQGEKPPVQLLADRISAVFVPVVIGIALLTLAGNWIYLGQFTPALMRSIAVLVIACPCAMGLATPAAIAVGLGRAAGSGILFRNAGSLEAFRHIRQVVFDKTGTLTTGEFSVSGFHAMGVDEDELKRIVWSLEKHSNHPIARCLAAAFKSKNDIRWKEVQEIKGTGMEGTDREGNRYAAGSFALAAGKTADDGHQVYVLRNDALIGWIDLADEIRPEADEVLQYLKSGGIRTILLSGDSEARCARLSSQLGMDAYHAGQSPAQKLEKITAFTNLTPTAMVGDGINDAPALAKATIGISLSDASQLAMQQAQVVLMNQGLRKLPLALGLGKHTYRTIQQNLFWAFFYNIVAIPVAAFGFLTPGFGALVMGLSDVVLGINSVRLFVKKVV